MAAERVVVTGDGDGVVGHAGARLLAEVADAVGLTQALARRPASRRRRRSRHDPGRVLRDVAVRALAEGRETGTLENGARQRGSGHPPRREQRRRRPQ